MVDILGVCLGAIVLLVLLVLLALLALLVLLILQYFFMPATVHKAVLGAVRMVFTIFQALCQGLWEFMPEWTTVRTWVSNLALGPRPEVVDEGSSETTSETSWDWNEGSAPFETAERGEWDFEEVFAYEMPNPFLKDNKIRCAGTGKNGPCNVTKIHTPGETIYLCRQHQSQSAWLAKCSPSRSKQPWPQVDY